MTPRAAAAIRYLLWDAGGTLFDSYPAKITAIRLAARSLGLFVPATRVSALLRHSTEHCLRTLAEAAALDYATLDACYRRIYSAIGARRQPPFPGVRRICEYVVASGGQNFIVTHRERASLQALLAAHAMADLFTDCITADDGYPRKPDPASLLALLARHALAPRAGLLVGDRDLDIEAGQRAGVLTCYFGRHPHNLPADVEAPDYTMLYYWLVKQNEALGMTNLE